MIKVYALAFVTVAVLVAIVWIFFVAPLGRQHHERQLEMIRKKIEQRERSQSESEASDSDT